MKQTILISLSIMFLAGGLLAQPAGGLKVLISVDMEGITSIVSADECNRRASDDYQYFRRIMTLEANAAVEGALAAGAAEIVVRDAHDTGRNILPDLLHKSARLLRGAGTPVPTNGGCCTLLNCSCWIWFCSSS